MIWAFCASAARHASYFGNSSECSGGGEGYLLFSSVHRVKGSILKIAWMEHVSSKHGICASDASSRNSFNFFLFLIFFIFG